MAVILRTYESKTWPKRAEYIDQNEAEDMVKAGTARRVGQGHYEAVALDKAQAPEDLDSVTDEDAEPQVYQTKDMLAEPKRRRRGRPRKTTPQPQPET